MFNNSIKCFFNYSLVRVFPFYFNQGRDKCGIRVKSNYKFDLLDNLENNVEN
jgi:hypothetical protein